MPIYNYSVLKGHPVSGKLSSGSIPHYLIDVDVNGATWEIAVNIESSDGSEVLYFLAEDFLPPDPAALDALPAGLTPLAGIDMNPAIDYQRTMVNSSPLITEQEMTLLPRPNDDGTAARALQNAVITFLNQATADPAGTVYAFGSQYTTGQGIHDIHMNQGNPAGSFEKDNGIWQDGMLIFQAPATGTWAAVLVAFQTEAWMTDDNGNPQ